MLTKLMDFFTNKIAVAPTNKPADTERNLRIATCALMVEIASIDEEFDSREKDRIIALFRDEYGLTEADTEELMQLARGQLDKRIDLWGFTNLINQHFNTEQKLKVIEMIWEVVYADGQLSAHEDYLIHKFYKMLNLSHGQMIDAKMKVLERRKK
jgi:uncharacterized tellurite resistance protein B-like protein